MSKAPYRMRVSELITADDSYESVDVDRIKEPILLQGQGITFNGRRLPDGSFIEISRFGSSFIINVREDELETDDSKYFLSIEIPGNQLIAKRKFGHDNISYVFACEELGDNSNGNLDNEVTNVLRFEYVV